MGGDSVSTYTAIRPRRRCPSPRRRVDADRDGTRITLEKRPMDGNHTAVARCKTLSRARALGCAGDGCGDVATAAALLQQLSNVDVAVSFGGAEGIVDVCDRRLSVIRGEQRGDDGGKTEIGRARERRVSLLVHRRVVAAVCEHRFDLREFTLADFDIKSCVPAMQ